MGALGRIVDVLDHRLALPLKLLTCLDAGCLNERASPADLWQSPLSSDSDFNSAALRNEATGHNPTCRQTIGHAEMHPA